MYQQQRVCLGSLQGKCRVVHRLAARRGKVEGKSFQVVVRDRCCVMTEPCLVQRALRHAQCWFAFVHQTAFLTALERLCCRSEKEFQVLLVVLCGDVVNTRIHMMSSALRRPSNADVANSWWQHWYHHDLHPNMSADGAQQCWPAST